MTVVPKPAVTPVKAAITQASVESEAHQPPPCPPTGNGATLNVTNPPATQLNPSAPVYTATPPINPSGPTVQPPTTLSLYADSNKTVLLQTAVAEVTNPRDPSYILKVKIVFDRKQKSYLTQRVKDSLALPVNSNQYLSIAAFGSNKGRPKQCEVVRLIVRTKLGGCQELQVFVVPHICDPVMSTASVACSKVYGCLSQLDLADVCLDETLEVDLLIGSDFY